MHFLMGLMLSGLLTISLPVNAQIGEITESSGKVQVKTVKAKRLDGVSGIAISNGDMIKVRKKSIAHIQMKDESKFQIGAKTTLVFDDFLYDAKNQKMRARIIDGALAYDGKKLVANSDREFSNNGFTLTVRGTKFAGKFAVSSQVILLKGAIDVSGKGTKQSLTQPMQSLIFDKNGAGKPFNMTLEDIKSFFDDNNLDFEKLAGNEFDTSDSVSKGRTCKMVLGKMVCTSG
jgi:hypothetical protein